MVQPTNKRLVTEASVGGHVLTNLTVDGPTKTALGEAIGTQITTPGTATATALSATYVRFVDEAGNPLASRHVVIKVSATTGEIIDIVSEV